MQTIDLAEKLARFSGHWDPQVVADYNENEVMVVKVLGEFPFHEHPDTDDFFLVVSGAIVIDIETPKGVVSHPLRAGQLFVVPKGVRHRPRAETEAHLLLIEPKGTPNTGDPATATRKPRL